MTRRDTASRVEAARAEGGTRVDVRAEDIPAGISAEEHAAGLASSPANLARRLQGRTGPGTVPPATRRPRGGSGAAGR
ncbi:hypothetical protein [Kocuria aegyptia]|uniref:Uncharacterized protein n=1 Tax=Kocuria aegyptia TaxID=330943 RepID=A0ABN2KT93_9MICC